MKDLILSFLLFFHNHIVAYTAIHLLRRWCLRNLMRIEIGDLTSIHMGLKLYTYGHITIGDNSVIDRDCALDGRGDITIGNNVNISPEVMILTAYHDPDSETFSGVHKAVVVEDYAWIATRALILPGVTIGRGAVVAAGAVVTKDVAPQTIVGGNPARLIRVRKNIQTYKLNYQRAFH
jgi:acetyltransferase-like isoleucine patch superfamily enzyme